MRRRNGLAIWVVLLLALHPGAAGADVPYTPPKVGLTIEFEGNFQGTPLELRQTVAAVDGDIVFARGSMPEHQDERYYRFLVSTKSGGNHYRMDTAKLAALWPLAPGKTVSLSGEMDNGKNRFPFDLTLTVQDYESIVVPAGAFDTIRVEYIILVGPNGSLARLESLTWIDVATSPPMRNQTTVVAMGRALALSMEAKGFD